MRRPDRSPVGCCALDRCSRRPECCSRRLNSRQSEAKPTPLPKLKVIVAGAVVLNNHFGAVLLFPFLPFMVQDFFPELSKEELGKKAGYLGSIYFLGSLSGSLFWGCLADRWGRRPVMMLGICGSFFSEILFGFSQNFTWALTARFLWGALNGNLGVSKTYISEVCDDSNMAKGFAVVGAFGGTGRLIASSIGGFLSQPASKYGLFEHPFFCQFPYLLPCLSAAIWAIVSLIASSLFLEETLHKGRFSHGFPGSDPWRIPTNGNAVPGVSEGDSTDIEMVSLSSDGMSSSGVEQPANQIPESDSDLQSDDATISDLDTDPLLREEDVGVAYQSGCGCMKKCIGNLRAVDPGNWMNSFCRRQRQQWLECCWCCVRTEQDPCTHRQPSPASCKELLQRVILGTYRGARRIVRLLRDRKVFISIALYSIFGSLTLALHELIPLLFVNDYEHGGYHLDDNEIGVLSMTGAVFEFFFQVFFYPRIAKLLSFRWMYRIAALVFLAGCVVIPFSNAITGPASLNVTTVTASGNGSGVWAGSGLVSVDYCGEDRNDSQVDVNEGSITRIPLFIWVMAEVALLLMVIPSLLGVTSLMVMIGNSSLKETRGSINGVSQSLVAVLRFVFPTLASLGLAWSEQNTDTGYSWPLNYHFVFDILALVTLATFFLSLFLPKTIETKRQR